MNILTIATRLFSEKGRDGVGIREIAGEANVSLNTVMYHFTSKENLFHQAVAHVLETTLPAEETIKQYENIDFTDKQAISNAFYGIVDTFFREVRKPEFTQGFDLLARTIYSHEHEILKTVLEGYNSLEDLFVEFFKRGGIEPSQESTHFWIGLMWGQMLLYISARDMISISRGEEELSDSFYDDIAYMVACSCTPHIGLPQPQQGKS
jgi:AcrR family transcriptional regulator